MDNISPGNKPIRKFRRFGGKDQVEHSTGQHSITEVRAESAHKLKSVCTTHI